MGSMTPITIDFETFYSKEYSLSKITTQEYVRSEFFEVILVSVQVSAGKPKWFSGTFEETKEWLRQFDWENNMAVAHNAIFDGSILEWLFDIHPKLWFCTMMGARPHIVPFTPRGRMSLASLADHLDIGKKGTEVVNALGMRRRDFSPAQLQRYADYCMQDVSLCHQLFRYESAKMPTDEIYLLHETIRKYVRPVMQLDRNALAQGLAETIQIKEQALARAGLTDNKMLMSNPKFAEALVALGVSPPTKISPTTGKETFAFAKTDAAMKELLDHDDPQVQALVAARLKHKSTQLETRLSKLISVHDSGGNLGVPLLYYGAHTGRLSGFDGLNLQNLPRKGPLRDAIIAPPGYKIVAGDLSQIEARITAVLARQNDLVEAFASGQDVYSNFASDLFAVRVTKETHPKERTIGKVCILGLGYGMGASKFRDTLRALSGIEITHMEAMRIVRHYRRVCSQVATLWSTLDGQLIKMIAEVPMGPIGPVMFYRNQIRLPNGMTIYYPNLHRSSSTGDIKFTQKGGDKYLWGGTVLENIVQALARIVISMAELRLAKRGLHAALQVHDELVYCVKESHVDTVVKALNIALTAPVPWMPTLPVGCEIKVGDNYGECK